AVTLGTPGRHPDDLAGHRDLLRFIHQVQEHEDLVPGTIVLVGRNEHAPVLDEGHIGGIKHRLVLDGQRENAVTGALWCCTHGLILETVYITGGSDYRFSIGCFQRSSRVSSSSTRFRLAFPSTMLRCSSSQTCHSIRVVVATRCAI